MACISQLVGLLPTPGTTELPSLITPAYLSSIANSKAPNSSHLAHQTDGFVTEAMHALNSTTDPVHVLVLTSLLSQSILARSTFLHPTPVFQAVAPLLPTLTNETLTPLLPFFQGLASLLTLALPKRTKIPTGEGQAMTGEGQVQTGETPEVPALTDELLNLLPTFTSTLATLAPRTYLPIYTPLSLLSLSLSRPPPVTSLFTSVATAYRGDEDNYFFGLKACLGAIAEGWLRQGNFGKRPAGRQRN